MKLWIISMGQWDDVCEITIRAKSAKAALQAFKNRQLKYHKKHNMELKESIERTVEQHKKDKAVPPYGMPKYEPIPYRPESVNVWSAKFDEFGILDTVDEIYRNVLA